MIVSKKCIAVLCIVLICLALCNIVYAKEAESQSHTTATPILQWVNVDWVDVDLTVKGTLATCSAVIIGKSGTEKITAAVVLARKNSDGSYTSVKTWNNLSVNGDSLFFDETYYVLSGYTYRLTVNAVIYLNGKSESISSNSDVT